MTKQEYMNWKWGAFSTCGHPPVKCEGRVFYLLEEPYPNCYCDDYKASAISKEAFDAYAMDEELESDSNVYWGPNPDWDEEDEDSDYDVVSYRFTSPTPPAEEEKINLTEAEKEEIYNQVCEDFGYLKECRFIEIEDDGRIGFTCGRPEEISGLYYKVVNSGKYKPSKGLEKTYFSIVPHW